MIKNMFIATDKQLKNIDKYLLNSIIIVLYIILLGAYFISFYSFSIDKSMCFVILIVISILFFSIYYRYVFKPIRIMEQNIQFSTSVENELNRKYSEKIAKKQAELDALQSQINPHFLYNTLESIRGEALEIGADEISDMTEALATFFRYSISQKGNLVTLREELNNVSCYFSIQRFRFSERFDLNIEYPPSCDDVMNTLMPKLTLQPIIENCIFHGLEPKIDKGKITMKITKSGSILILKISDNGIGMSEEVLEKLNRKLSGKESSTHEEETKKHTGIALINVNQRVKILFGEEYGIRVMSHKDIGTDIELTLPFKIKQKEIDFMME